MGRTEFLQIGNPPDKGAYPSEGGNLVFRKHWMWFDRNWTGLEDQHLKQIEILCEIWVDLKEVEKRIEEIGHRFKAADYWFRRQERLRKDYLAGTKTLQECVIRASRQEKGGVVDEVNRKNGTPAPPNPFLT